MLFGPEESLASIFLNSELVSTKAELTRVAAELAAEKEKHCVSELAFRDQIAASERCLEETQAESSALKKDKAALEKRKGKLVKDIAAMKETLRESENKAESATKSV